MSQLDMNLVLTLMFHEAFHITYDEQPLAVKLEFATWLRDNPSRYSQYAQLLFNEAVTTALASGYLHSYLDKTPVPP